jgi:hypothetical protein
MSTDWNCNKLSEEDVEAIFEVLGVEKGTQYVFPDEDDD